LVRAKKDPTSDDKPHDFKVVPGPAEEAEGTIHPAQDPPTFGKVIDEYAPAIEEVTDDPPPYDEAVPETGVGGIVDQVLRGEWGVGQDRRLRLAKAGYKPNEIQKEIVRRANNR
jgi:hypothetical protein